MADPIPADRWAAPDGVHNAREIMAAFPYIFDAFAEYDAYGHRLGVRVAAKHVVSTDELLVGMALLRRAQMVFAGIRALCESSCVDPAKGLVRAQFELMLAVRYLMFGGHRNIMRAPAAPRGREARARYYLLASERRKLYTWQSSLVHRDSVHPTGRVVRARIFRDVAATRARLEKQYPTQWRSYGEMRYENAIAAKRKYRDHWQWYSFGFRKHRPTTVSGLANRLGYRWEYMVLYGTFSALVHPSGVWQDVTVEGDRLHIHSVHDPSWLHTLARWSLPWQMSLLLWFTRAYHPESMHDLQETYARAEPFIERIPEPHADNMPPGFVD